MLARMALEEHDREDLLREATALKERVELQRAGDAAGEHVVVGFRADGAASIYFGGDLAYHFNASGALRRAHRNGLLYKAEQGCIVSLQRRREDNQLQLLSRPLSEGEQADFLAAMLERLRVAASEIAERQLIATGQVPKDADVIGRAMAWLTNIKAISVAQSPHAR
jgi:hypothetical protein